MLAASFPETDSDIDARPYSFDAGEEDPEFKGFHRIEALLYRDGDLKAALPYAEGLVASVKTPISELKLRARRVCSASLSRRVVLVSKETVGCVIISSWIVTVAELALSKILAR